MTQRFSQKANIRFLLQDLQRLREIEIDNRQLDFGSDWRSQALETARAIVRKLEGPKQTVFRHAFESHGRSLCLRLAVDLRLCHIMIGSEKVSISAQELAASSNSEELLVVRVMRVLVAEGYAANEGARRYTSTALSAALTDPAIEACVVHSFDITARVQSFLPEYFQQHGYHSPVHPKNGPFQYAFGTDLSFFEFLHSQPKRAQTFNTYMTGNRSNRQHWLDWFPFHENVLRTWEERNDSKEMLLVDMGGGKGHDLKRLLEKYPEAKGRLVLEDLPGALQDFEDHGCSITTYAHDIFTPQPVKGAAVYYTHFLLHDFPDQMCIEMLRQTDQAMGIHSCILLNEIMLPETDCPSFFAAADITMMSNLSALARSKDQWRTLVHAAGLVIRKIWMSPDLRDWEVVIEIGRRSSDS